MEIVKVSSIGIVGIILAVYFRTIKAEYSVYIGMVTGVVIFGYTIHYLAYFAEQIQILKDLFQMESDFFAILLKAVCVAYLSEFSAGICKDAGYSAVGAQIELFGKVMVLMLGLPIVLSVIRTIQHFKG